MLTFLFVMLGVVLILGFVWLVTPDGTKKKATPPADNTAASTKTGLLGYVGLGKVEWKKTQETLLSLFQVIIYGGVALMVVLAIIYGGQKLRQWDPSATNFTPAKTMIVPLEYGKWSEPLPEKWPSNRIRWASEPTDIAVTIRIPGQRETYLGKDAHYKTPTFSHQTQTKWQWKLETPLEKGKTAYIRVTWP